MGGLERFSLSYAKLFLVFYGVFKVKKIWGVKAPDSYVVIKLFAESCCNVNGACHGAAHHRVVADAEEAHHFHVSGN